MAARIVHRIESLKTWLLQVTEQESICEEQNIVASVYGGCGYSHDDRVTGVRLDLDTYAD